MRKERLILDQQLSHLEAEKELMDAAILEVYRRLEVLDEIQSWNLLPEHEDTVEPPATDQLEDDSELEIEWARTVYSSA